MGGPSEILRAHVLSPGSAEGPVFALGGPPSDLADTFDPSVLESARIRALGNLTSLAREVGEEGSILEAQALFLDDPTITLRAAELTPQEGARTAIDRAVREASARLLELDDPYLRERAQDIVEVGRLWTQALGGVELALPDEPSIIVTEELAVGWLLRASRLILGALVVKGSPTMHAAIVCKNLGLPLLRIDDPRDLSRALAASRIALDGKGGRVDLRPGIGGTRGPRDVMAPFSGPVGVFGVPVEIRANVASEIEAEAARRFGASGVGLLRTELAFVAASRPLTEDEQCRLYCGVARSVGGPITVRLLDVGADKPVPGISVPQEANPQLGQRGVRLLRKHPALIRTQLRALFRASAEVTADRKIEAMVPMVATPSDWDFVLREVDQIEAALASERVPYVRPPLGMMLEVPSALFQIAEFIRRGASFFSIGTNDLAQYVYAADRENRRVEIPRAPLVLFRLLDAALGPARDAGVRIAACGEMASDPLLAPLLVLVGVRELSVAASLIPELRPALEALSGEGSAGPLRELLERSRDDREFERGLTRLIGRNAPPLS